MRAFRHKSGHGKELRHNAIALYNCKTPCFIGFGEMQSVN